MLQDKINKIDKYFKGMELTNGTFIVNVKYEPKWGVYPSDDDTIKVTPSEEKADEWFYYAKASERTIDDIFELIEATVDSNLAAIEKYKLLMEKFDELKELFSKEELERLKTLKFTLGKKKKGRKPKKKEIKEPIVEDKTNVDGNNVEENEVEENA